MDDNNNDDEEIDLNYWYNNEGEDIEFLFSSMDIDGIRNIDYGIYYFDAYEEDIRFYVIGGLC